jgi:hypothetical protein
MAALWTDSILYDRIVIVCNMRQFNSIVQCNVMARSVLSRLDKRLCRCYRELYACGMNGYCRVRIGALS